MAARLSIGGEDWDTFDDGIAKGERIQTPYQGMRQRRKQVAIKMLPSEWVSRFVRVKDGDTGRVAPVDFSERKYLLRPYDTPSRKILFLTSRQAEKSTTLGNKLFALSCMRPMYTSLFVSPSAMQTVVFSRTRLADIIEISPLLKAHTHMSLTNNILERQFVNLSKTYLRYAFLNADRIRGLSANALFVDEIQDVLIDNMPVIEETLSHHKDPVHVYSGTPKSLDNNIEKYWSKSSTMSEWSIPCERHGTPKQPASWHWNVLGPDNIGLTGPVCDRCQKPINPEHPYARWVAMSPGAEFEGFRICRLMVPWFYKNPDKWKDILEVRDRYPTAKFMNEVLALSYDSGSKPITKAEVMRACDPRYSGTEDHAAELADSHTMYAGVDWGCYDEQTRTLTDKGWKYHWEIGNEDLVAQYAPDTHEISYVKPLRKIVFDHEGDMIEIKNKNVDMLVTPDHKMLFRHGSNKSRGVWYEGEAQDLVDRDVRFRPFGDWKGRAQPTFEMVGRSVPMEAWMRFLGLIISEGFIGHSGHYRELSISQRIKKPYRAEYIAGVLCALGLEYRVRCVNKKTNDWVWTLCGKEKDALWSWFRENVGTGSKNKRIPRELLDLATPHLEPLVEALIFGDGTYDYRDPSRGAYYTTSEQLKDDVLELFLKTGYRTCISYVKEPQGNRNRRWSISFSRNKEITVNRMHQSIRRVPYKGKCYCFTMPKGYFITERNGRIAQQGNTGDRAFTVLVVMAYCRDDGGLQVVHMRRFDGPMTDPELQLEEIIRIIKRLKAKYVGVDYGMGFYPNKRLSTVFGPDRIRPFQYVARLTSKVAYSRKLHRYLTFRTPVMSDCFTAIKRLKIRLPAWRFTERPFSDDIRSIYAEYSETLKMIRYDKPSGLTDDSFHSIVYAMLASFFDHLRPDIMAPIEEVKAMDQTEYESILMHEGLGYSPM